MLSSTERSICRRTGRLKNDLDVPAPLTVFRDRMMELPSVKTAMTHEELI